MAKLTKSDVVKIKRTIKRLQNLSKDWSWVSSRLEDVSFTGLDADGFEEIVDEIRSLPGGEYDDGLDDVSTDALRDFDVSEVEENFREIIGVADSQIKRLEKILKKNKV